MSLPHRRTLFQSECAQPISLLQIDVIKGKGGENRLVISLNGKVGPQLRVRSAYVHHNLAHVWTRPAPPLCLFTGSGLKRLHDA